MVKQIVFGAMLSLLVVGIVASGVGANEERLFESDSLEPLDTPVRVVFSVRNHTFSTTTVLPEYRVTGKWNHVENYESREGQSEAISSMDEGLFSAEGILEFDKASDSYLITCNGVVEMDRVENSGPGSVPDGNAPQSEVVSSMDTFALNFEASTRLKLGAPVALVRKDNDVLTLKLEPIN